MIYETKEDDVDEYKELVDLDDSWLVEFETVDNDYKYFYKENVSSVKIRCMYINKNNCLEKIKEEVVFLKAKNKLSKEEIIEILKKNNTENKIKYSLMNLLKYNIDLEPENMKSFLKWNTKNDIKNKNIEMKYRVEMKYLTSIKTIDDIYFKPTIYMFQDLTDIFILFYETPTNHSKCITKKIFINSTPKNKTYKKTT